MLLLSRKTTCKGHMRFKDYNGDILYSILPNTSTLVGTSCKYFTRVNKNLLDEEYLVPDVVIDLDDPEKDLVWEWILKNYGK